MLQLRFEPLDSLILEPSNFKTHVLIFSFIQQLSIERHLYVRDYYGVENRAVNKTGSPAWNIHSRGRGGDPE